MKRSLFVVLAAAAACGGSPKTGQIAHDDVPPPRVAASAGEELTFAGPGVTISATYWAPSDPANQACVLFVHQLSSTRAEYLPVIERLRGQGHLLAIDMRGHGKSTAGDGGTSLDWKTFETADWQQVALDVRAAADALADRGAADACVWVGASIGSSAVLLAAAANPDRTRALVLLSPGLAYRGVETPDAARAVRVPVLIVVSREAGAADASGALSAIFDDNGVRVEAHAAMGTAHGMKIVAGEPGVLDHVVEFISGGLTP
jgi:pimeloyl-ACP methyl ester carboxylesterase